MRKGATTEDTEEYEGHGRYYVLAVTFVRFL